MSKCLQEKTLCNLYIWSILGVSLFQGVVSKIPFDLVNLPFSHKGCPLPEKNPEVKATALLRKTAARWQDDHLTLNSVKQSLVGG